MASEIKVDTIVNAGGDNDSGIDLATNDNIKFNIAGSQKAIIDSSGKVGIGESSPSALLHLKNDGPNIKLEDSDNDSDFEIKNGNGTLRIIDNTNSADRMTIDSSGDLRVQRIQDNTTSGGANVRVQSDGLLQRDTSSQRYKNTINDATHGLTELLNLRSVTFKGNNDGDTIFGGLIAEEVHDAGLTEFVEYDDQNRPDALRYSNMVSLCIKAIQELKTELDNAKARITALESK